MWQLYIKRLCVTTSPECLAREWFPGPACRWGPRCHPRTGSAPRPRSTREPEQIKNWCILETKIVGLIETQKAIFYEQNGHPKLGYARLKGRTILNVWFLKQTKWIYFILCVRVLFCENEWTYNLTNFTLSVERYRMKMSEWMNEWKEKWTNNWTNERNLTVFEWYCIKMND